MPEMDGLTAVTEIRKTHPNLPIIMFSTLSQRAAKETLEALARGANDYVTKPANVGSAALAMQRVREELIPKIKTLARPESASLKATTSPLPQATKSTGSTPKARRKSPFQVDIVAIGDFDRWSECVSRSDAAYSQRLSCADSDCAAYASCVYQMFGGTIVRQVTDSYS